MISDISRRGIILGGAGVAGATAFGGPTTADGGISPPRSASVTDFMTAEQQADILTDQPRLDATAAFDAAWKAVSEHGGVLHVPPGNYILASPWHCQVTTPSNILVLGWGARLFAERSFEGPAIIVRGCFNEYVLDIEGLAFDHRWNASVEGCIKVLGGHCVHIRRCVLEYAAVRQGYYFVRFASDPTLAKAGEGRDDRNSFWCRVDGCSIRRRTGAEPGEAAYFAQIVGNANAAVFTDNCIQHCTVGLSFEPDPMTGSLANGVVIERNFFEGVALVGIRVAIASDHYGPTGLRIVHNRFENCPVAFEVVSGPRVKIHSQPPLLFGNYYTYGSVETVIRNVGNYPVSIIETITPGMGPAIDNEFHLSGNLRLRFDRGKDLELSGYDGSAKSDRGRLLFGRNAALWFNPTDGKLHAGAEAPGHAQEFTLDRSER